MALKVYVDRMSQPSRAILLLCKVNGIEFEEVDVQLAKSEHRSSEFAEINPMKQVPAIVHGDFKLFERKELQHRGRKKVTSSKIDLGFSRRCLLNVGRQRSCQSRPPTSEL